MPFLFYVPKYTIVPDLYDLSQAAAEAAIVAADLVVGSSDSAYDEITAGNVYAQSPAAGLMVHAGTSVDINISLGPEHYWDQKFYPTSWTSALYGTWDSGNQRWQSAFVGGANTLSIYSGGWRTGYRPTKIRIDYNGISIISYLRFKKSSGSNFVIYTSYNTGVELNINITQDIYRMELQTPGTNDTFYVTNIEFYI